MVLCRKVFHAVVLFEAHHLNGSDTAILGHCKHAFKQGIPDPDVLPISFDRKCSFARCGPRMNGAVQFSNTAQLPVNECAADNTVMPKNTSRIFLCAKVTGCPAKTRATRPGIETLKVIANAILVS